MVKPEEKASTKANKDLNKSRDARIFDDSQDMNAQNNVHDNSQTKSSNNGRKSLDGAGKSI